MDEVILFTDGSCLVNPGGPGGWACIVNEAGKERVLSGGEASTTNNRMEMMALIEGLRSLEEPSEIEVVTDSTYVAFGASKWIEGWKKTNWKRGKLKNIDLWQEIDRLSQQHEITYTVIKGHSGHPENERCDELAYEEALKF